MDKNGATMSLDIPMDKVSAVLLSDGWHVITPGSFALETYSYKRADGLAMYSTQESGFRIVDGTGTVCGPITSILAIRVAEAE
jgi:hypothetical protein